MDRPVPRGKRKAKSEKHLTPSIIDELRIVIPAFPDKLVFTAHRLAIETLDFAKASAGNQADTDLIAFAEKLDPVKYDLPPDNRFHIELAIALDNAAALPGRASPAPK